MFIDHIRIHATAGDGGTGCVSFRRESFVPKGGPDGGDGGGGGSVILEADVHSDNLTQFFYEPNVKAKNGQQGGGKQCSGKTAPDKIVKVPVGTIVYRLPGEEPEEGLDPSIEYGTNSTFIDFSKAPASEKFESPMRGRRSEEHTSELQSRRNISYAVFCFVGRSCSSGSGDLEKSMNVEFVPYSIEGSSE